MNSEGMHSVCPSSDGILTSVELQDLKRKLASKTLGGPCLGLETPLNLDDMKCLLKL